jgi:hypothetical protein
MNGDNLIIGRSNEASISTTLSIKPATTFFAALEVDTNPGAEYGVVSGGGDQGAILGISVAVQVAWVLLAARSQEWLDFLHMVPAYTDSRLP